MSNPKAEAIQRFSKQAFEHIEAFDKALADYPTTQTFVIVVTNDPNVYNFVPKHLARFTSDTVRLGTIDRPGFGEPSYMQLMRKSVTILDDLSPRHRLEMDNNMADFADILKSTKRKVSYGYGRFEDQFAVVDDIVTYAKDHKSPWLDQATLLQKQIVIEFTVDILRTLDAYKAKYAGQPTYQSITDLGFRMHDHEPCITLNDIPLQSKIVIWDWIESQGLDPNNANDKNTIVDKVNDLALNVLSVAGIVDTAINNTTDKYRKDITALNTLTFKDQNGI